MMAGDASRKASTSASSGCRSGSTSTGAHYLDELVARDDLGASPETYFFLQDTNYNVVALYKRSTGSIVERYWYEPYGTVTIADANGAKTLAAHFHIGREITSVPDAGTINLGNASLACFETKMLHWPDSMISYLAKDELLFSQDAFGMHLASGERFADELDEDILDLEARKYYANILLPLSSLVTKALERLAKLNAPSRSSPPATAPSGERTSAGSPAATHAGPSRSPRRRP